MIMGQVKNSFEIAAIVAVFVAGASMFTASSTYNIANAQGGQQQIFRHFWYCMLQSSDQ